jgi:hypothetical protein
MAEDLVTKTLAIAQWRKAFERLSQALEKGDIPTLRELAIPCGPTALLGDAKRLTLHRSQPALSRCVADVIVQISNSGMRIEGKRLEPLGRR